MSEKKNKQPKVSQMLILAGLLVILDLFIFQEALAAACANVPLGGNYTVTTSCAFDGTVNGVENGTTTISSGTTLTINSGQTVVWNPGYSIIINGSIAINKGTPGGQLRKTYIWLSDGDNDSYPSTAAPAAQNDQPSGGKRRSHTDFTTKFTYITDITYDYNDTDATVYPGERCEGPCTINLSDGTCGNTASGSNPGGIALSCSVTSGSCANTTVFKISATDNAHAELSGSYTYYVCCSGNSLGTSCSGKYDTVLKLSGTSNAHGEKKTQANYANSACLSTTYGQGQQNPSTIACSYATDCSTLGSLYNCLASISGDTNAHVGDCTAYTTKVCCANVCP